MGDKALKWPNNSTLKVWFLPGPSSKVKYYILDTAREWTKYTDIKFEETFSLEESNIRVGFGCYATDPLVAKCEDEQWKLYWRGWRQVMVGVSAGFSKKPKKKAVARSLYIACRVEYEE